MATSRHATYADEDLVELYLVAIGFNVTTRERLSN